MCTYIILFSTASPPLLHTACVFNVLAVDRVRHGRQVPRVFASVATRLGTVATPARAQTGAERGPMAEAGTTIGVRSLPNLFSACVTTTTTKKIQRRRRMKKRRKRMTKKRRKLPRYIRWVAVSTDFALVNNLVMAMRVRVRVVVMMVAMVMAKVKIRAKQRQRHLLQEHVSASALLPKAKGQGVAATHVLHLRTTSKAWPQG